MMRGCDSPFCKEWAQWHVMLEKKGVPRSEWERLRFCNKHKQEFQKERKDEPRWKYIFIGAEPSGRNPA